MRKILVFMNEFRTAGFITCVQRGCDELGPRSGRQTCGTGLAREGARRPGGDVSHASEVLPHELESREGTKGHKCGYDRGYIVRDAASSHCWSDAHGWGPRSRSGPSCLINFASSATAARNRRVGEFRADPRASVGRAACGSVGQGGRFARDGGDAAGGCGEISDQGRANGRGGVGAPCAQISRSFRCGIGAGGPDIFPPDLTYY